MDQTGLYFFWVVGFVILGPAQVWLGAWEDFRSAQPPRSFRSTLWENLTDCNLYLFSLATAGGVFATFGAYMFYLKGVLAANAATLAGAHAQPAAAGHNLGFAAWLLLPIFLIVVVAAPGWVGFKNKMQAAQKTGIQYVATPIDVRASILCAAGALICAFLAEQLKP